MRIKVQKQRIVTTIITGGVVALCGKIIHDFYHEIIGNSLIIVAYIISALLLFVTLSTSSKEKIYIK